MEGIDLWNVAVRTTFDSVLEIVALYVYAQLMAGQKGAQLS